MLETRVGDHSIEAAKPLECSADGVAVALARRQITAKRHSGPRTRRAQIGGQHVHPVIHEALRDCSADTARCSGDERDAAGEGFGSLGQRP
jgi:hypothetical protein